MPKQVEYDALAQFKAPSALLEQVRVAASERCITFSGSVKDLSHISSGDGSVG